MISTISNDYTFNILSSHMRMVPFLQQSCHMLCRCVGIFHIAISTGFCVSTVENTQRIFVGRDWMIMFIDMFITQTSGNV